MTQTLGEIIYFLYFIVTKPFKNFWVATKDIANKPKRLLDLSIIVTIALMERDAVIKGLFFLFNNAVIRTEVMIMFTITLLIYVWKYADTRSGESWKADHNQFLAKKARKMEERKNG